MPTYNAAVRAVVAPPVTTAKARALGRSFPAERPLLDLSQAVPSYPPAEALRDFLAEEVHRPDTAAYSPVLGLPHTRGAVAGHVARTHHAPVADGNVLVSAGCNEAFCLAVSAVAGPGDEVVLPVPFYFNHDMWLRAQGIRPTYVPGDPDRGLEPDPDAVRSAVTPRTRAIVLVSPNNPTGTTYRPATIDAIGAVAADHDLLLVIDETYVGFRAGGVGGPGQRAHAPHRLLHGTDSDDAESWPPHVALLWSFSKSLSLAGHRCGALLGHPDLLAEAAKLADCLTIGAPRLAQEAVAFGLAELGPWMGERRAEMLERVEAFTEGFAAPGGPADAGWQLRSAGGFFAYVHHPTLTVDDLLDRHHVLAIPGAAFGPDQKGCIRLAFGNVDPDQITEAIGRLAEAR